MRDWNSSGRRFWDHYGLLDTWDDSDFLNAWLHWGRGPVREQMQHFVAGDTKELNVFPCIPALRSGVTRVIAKAWLTIKSPEASADPVENAVWSSQGGMQSVIATDAPGLGQIVNSSEGSPELRFDITAVNSANLTPHRMYYCAIQVLMDDAALYEVERFTFETARQFTDATS